MKALELAKKLMLYSDKDVKIFFNIRNNKTDEVELYETNADTEIQVGELGTYPNDVIIRTEILVK